MFHHLLIDFTCICLSVSVCVRTCVFVLASQTEELLSVIFLKAERQRQRFVLMLPCSLSENAAAPGFSNAQAAHVMFLPVNLTSIHHLLSTVTHLSTSIVKSVK